MENVVGPFPDPPISDLDADELIVPLRVKHPNLPKISAVGSIAGRRRRCWRLSPVSGGCAGIGRCRSFASRSGKPLHTERKEMLLV